MTGIADHLWQSTLFTLAVALLATLWRKQSAAVRYWLWAAASLKFLVPFSLLVSFGGLLGSYRTIEPAHAGWQSVIDQVSPPLATLTTPVAVAQRTLPPPSRSNSLPEVLLTIWGCGALATAGLFGLRWARIRQAVQRARPLDCEFAIPVLCSDTLLEPGVFGVWRPKLVLPEGITERLSQEQMTAILAHEWCHVQRKDNLIATFHMAVQILFWFHPLVWWVGGRLVEERESACDEEVLRLGNDAEAYAEGIVTVCKFYLESPLMCASGVTGANLRKRIEAIMQNTISKQLTITRKAVLAAAAASAVAVPVVVGIMHAPQALAQSASPIANSGLAFDVASVKPANPESRGVSIQITPGGGLNISNAPLREIIALAYDVRNFQISGGPSWIGSERFSINAKMEGAEPPPDFRRMPDGQRVQMEEQMRQRLRSLLAERFQLAVRQETKEMAAYALTVAKGGPKLKTAEGAEDGPRGMRMQRGQLSAQSAAVEMLARVLSNELRRPVVDQTELKGNYDFELKWVPEMGAGGGPFGDPVGPPEPPPAAADTSGPSIFTAVQEQLGLKLESRKVPVVTIVIDRVEKPSAN